MDTKVQNIKTKRQKNSVLANQRKFAKKIADICECSPRQVQYVLNGERGKFSKLAPKINKAVEMYQAGESELFNDIKQKLNPKRA